VSEKLRGCKEAVLVPWRPKKFEKTRKQKEENSICTEKSRDENQIDGRMTGPVPFPQALRNTGPVPFPQALRNDLAFLSKLHLIAQPKLRIDSLLATKHVQLNKCRHEDV
jgi:hypothetical protein